MKKLFGFIIFLLLIGMGGYIYLTEKGHDIESIINSPKKIDLNVKCSSLENLLVKSMVDVTVENLYGRTHRNVNVRVTAFDENHNILKQKVVIFEDELRPESSLTKKVFLPAKTIKCECIVIDSNPY